MGANLMNASRSAPPRALIALNAALLLVLGVVTLAPESYAQRAAHRIRGEYTMVSGRIMGGNTSAVYIVDAANQELLAVRWNPATKALEGIGYRNLRADGQFGPGR
jgi:hypothetical protein